MRCSPASALLRRTTKQVLCSLLQTPGPVLPGPRHRHMPGRSLQLGDVERSSCSMRRWKRVNWSSISQKLSCIAHRWYSTERPGRSLGLLTTNSGVVGFHNPVLVDDHLAGVEDSESVAVRGKSDHMTLQSSGSARRPNQSAPKPGGVVEGGPPSTFSSWATSATGAAWRSRDGTCRTPSSGTASAPSQPRPSRPPRGCRRPPSAGRPSG